VGGNRSPLPVLESQWLTSETSSMLAKAGSDGGGKYWVFVESEETNCSLVPHRGQIRMQPQRFFQRRRRSEGKGTRKNAK